jgi:hypothetical protein
MLWKVYEANRAPHPNCLQHHDPSCGLGKVNDQIKLIQSLIFNLPFLVGANLFFMGLPGTGSAEAKAWLDCFFLLGTVIVFSGLYFANQQALRKQLLPLRHELEACVAQVSL